MDAERRMFLRGDNSEYNAGYLDGFEYAVRLVGNGQTVSPPKPYLTKEDIMERYGGITEAKSRDIIKAVRRWVGGGKLPFDFMILRSELELWERDVEKNYTERL